MKGNSLMEMNTAKISYYSSYRDFSKKSIAGFWPFLASFGLFGTLGPIFNVDYLTTALLVLGLLSLLICSFVTKFYANALLIITEKGITIRKKKIELNFDWKEISKITYFIPQPGPAYLQIIMVLNKKDNDDEYLFLDSLYFRSAISRMKRIQNMINKHFTSEHNFQKGYFDTRRLTKM